MFAEKRHQTSALPLLFVNPRISAGKSLRADYQRFKSQMSAEKRHQTSALPLLFVNPRISAGKSLRADYQRFKSKCPQKKASNIFVTSPVLNPRISAEKIFSR
jgi:hypothetical protein